MLFFSHLEKITKIRENLIEFNDSKLTAELSLRHKDNLFLLIRAVKEKKQFVTELIDGTTKEAVFSYATDFIYEDDKDIDLNILSFFKYLIWNDFVSLYGGIALDSGDYNNEIDKELIERISFSEYLSHSSHKEEEFHKKLIAELKLSLVEMVDIDEYEALMKKYMNDNHKYELVREIKSTKGNPINCLLKINNLRHIYKRR